MDVRKLSFFLAVVDHGSFTKAAAASYLSQPGLSKAVADLEQEVGARLFDRVGHRVRLTPRAKRSSPRPVRSCGTSPPPRRPWPPWRSWRRDPWWSVACRHSLPTRWPRSSGPSAGSAPGCRSTLAAPEDPADLQSMVRSGTVEVAVTEARRSPSGLIAHPLGSQELVAILPPGSIPSRQRLTLRQLAEYPLVVTPRGTSSRGVLDEALAAAGIELTVAVETAQREAVLPLVLAGSGVALVPAPLAEAAALQHAVVARLRPALTRYIALVHRDAPLSPAATEFRAIALPLHSDPDTTG